GDGAIRALASYRKQSPASSRARTALARAQRLTGAYGDAERSLRQVLGGAPEHFPGLLEKALLEMTQGNLEEADHQLRRALATARWPLDEARAHEARAELYLRSGRPGKALEATQKALTAQAHSARAWWLEGVARVRLGQLDEALRSADRILQRWQARGSRRFMEYHHHLLALVARHQGRTADALESLTMALELDPAERAFFLTEAGDLLAEADAGSGRTRDQALERYQEALESNPKHVPALCGTARMVELGGDRARAKALYRRAEALIDAGTTDRVFAGCLSRLRDLELSLGSP
ncbi:MAG: tetratricopeptide repeat protein, partial [Holophagales bacterium]|nr:tetratricopeptide repeat protein [Holophagales bacterium]